MTFDGLNIEDSGDNNLVDIDQDSIFKRSRFIIKGDNNIIKLSKTLSYTNFIINIRGNNKKITIKASNKNINGLKLVSIRGDNQVFSFGENFSCGGLEVQMNDGDEMFTVGDNCLFSWGIKARTSDGHSIVDLNTKRAINPPKDIHIADLVWVGEDVSFLKGSKISANSVVGSRAVVTKSFEKTNIVVAGFPAKIMKENITWDRRKPSEYNSSVDSVDSVGGFLDLGLDRHIDISNLRDSIGVMLTNAETGIFRFIHSYVNEEGGVLDNSFWDTFFDAVSDVKDLERISYNKVHEITSLEKIRIHHKFDVKYIVESRKMTSFISNGIKKAVMRDFTPPSKIIDNSYILICGYLPATMVSSHTHLVSNHIKSILSADKNCSVVLLVTGEYDFLLEDTYISRWPNGKNLINLENSGFKDSLCSDELSRFKLINISEEVSVHSNVDVKYERAVKHIFHYSPSKIFLIGGGGVRSQYIDAILSGVYKLVYLPTSIDDNPLRHCDYSISHWIGHSNSVGIDSKYVPLVCEPQGGAVTDSQHNSTSDSVNIVSALSRNLLPNLLKQWKSDHANSAYYNEFIDILEDANVCWNIVGRTSVEDLKNVDERVSRLIEKGVINVTPFQKDLRHFFRENDLYLQPIGFTGGGNSALMAAAEGLSVLSLSLTDPAAYFPDFVFPSTVADYMMKLKEYLNEPLRMRSDNKVFINCFEKYNYEYVGKILLS